jgi:hypothetical protein
MGGFDCVPLNQRRLSSYFGDSCHSKSRHLLVSVL